MYELCDITQLLEWDTIPDSTKNLILRNEGFGVIGTIISNEALQAARKSYDFWLGHSVILAHSGQCNVEVGEA